MVGQAQRGERQSPEDLGMEQRQMGLGNGGQGPRSAGSTHIGKWRLVMLVLNPRGYSQGAVQ